MSTRVGPRAAFDIGGTFTDIGPVGRLFIDKILTPPDSVGAGGGRLAWIDDGALRVGPRSAEAAPGPAWTVGAGRNRRSPTPTSSWAT